MTKNIKLLGAISSQEKHFNKLKRINKMNASLQVNSEVLSSKIDEEAILMSIEAESYFGLNPVGSRIWELLLKQPSTIDEIVVTLMEEYEVIASTCREHVKEFLDDMYAKKLIQQIPVTA